MFRKSRDTTSASAKAPTQPPPSPRQAARHARPAPRRAPSHPPAVAPAATPIVLHEQNGGITLLTLNRPEARNSLSEAMLAALGEAFIAIAKDTSVRAVVIAANGPAFCAGHDLKELTSHRSDTDQGRAHFARVMESC